MTETDEKPVAIVTGAGGSLGRATALLATIARRSPAETRAENPIALLERMATTDSLAYVPLVYGYVNYSTAALQFQDAPRWGTSTRLGSTIGGTGIAISKRCPVTPELVEHLTWLLDPETQRTFIPQHAGQPGLRSAWHDVAVNEAAQNFYSNTATTIEESWVRPRYDGYIAFQAKASELLRDALLGGVDAAESCLDALDAAFASSTRIDATDARIHSATPTTSGVSA
ncbi:hypothetical protein [Pseudoclavibacter helvolus]|uniref:hypothetical protein n=1 Tax=Pseudoclavibacter helvolus TaxID=255205 RepID=UPI0008383789|nr:hypothetical protein [Pseudoclavibacter helvolus]